MSAEREDCVRAHRYGMLCPTLLQDVTCGRLSDAVFILIPLYQFQCLLFQISGDIHELKNGRTPFEMAPYFSIKSTLSKRVMIKMNTIIKQEWLSGLTHHLIAHRKSNTCNVALK